MDVNTLLGAVTAFMIAIGAQNYIAAGVIIVLAIGGMILFLNYTSHR